MLDYVLICFRPEQKEAKLVALAKEAGFGDDEPETESTHTVEAKKDVKIMKSQLKVLLQQPVIDPLNSSRFGLCLRKIKIDTTIAFNNIV